jgi:hypothetical protein
MFCSCEKKEEFTYERKETTEEYTYRFILRGNAGYQGSEDNIISLYDVFDEEIAKRIAKAELQTASIRIVGLDKMNPKPVLTKMELELYDIRKLKENLVPYVTADYEDFNFTDINITSDRSFSGTRIDLFFNTMFYFYNHSARELMFRVHFTPSENLTNNDEVYMEVKFKGHYEYIITN